MAVKDEAQRLADSLTGWLAEVALTGHTADQVNERLVEAVAQWAQTQGWRVYRGARSVLPLPAPYADRHSTVDIGIARDSQAPVVVEVDRSDRRRTVDKLVAEAAAGRVALWVRWGTGEFLVPPPPVRLVACPVVARKLGTGQKLFFSAGQELEAPEHSGVDLTQGEQAELFSGEGNPGPP